MTAKHFQEQGEDSPEDTKWYCYSRSDWKEFWLDLWVARNKDACFLWSRQVGCFSTWISALLALWWQSRAHSSDILPRMLH